MVNQRNKAALPGQPKQNPHQANMKRPAAPPVYRPQPVPKCLQARMSGSQRPAANAQQTPQAPPPYRPNPTPRVLQAKKPNAQPSVNQPRPAPVAPPPYRPQPVPRVLQSKTAQTRGGAQQPKHEAQQPGRRPSAHMPGQPPTALESLRARLSGIRPTPVSAKSMINAATVQRSVIQAHWAATNGAMGTWIKGTGDAVDGDYQHVGDHLFRKIIASSSSNSHTLGDELYKWNESNNGLQNVRLTKRITQQLQAGNFNQAIPFDPKVNTEKESTNLTLYGLQANPPKYIRYNIKNNDVVLVDQQKDTETKLSGPFNPKAQFIEHDGQKYFRMDSSTTGLEKTRTLFFYLKEQVSNATQTKDANQSQTEIKAGSTKEMNDVITKSNIQVWEPMKTRSMSQNSVMNGVSAAQEAASLGMDSGDWHWCHLIAHSMGALGNPQVPGNLVAGTAACNGAMAFLEKAIKEYVKKTGYKVHVSVIAQLIPPTHVAKAIKYKVEIPLVHGDATFYFDPLNHNKAAIQHADLYAAVLIDSLSVGSHQLDTPDRANLIRGVTGKQHAETPERLESQPSPSSPILSPSSLSNLYNPTGYPTLPSTPLSNYPASSPNQNFPAPSPNTPSSSSQDFQPINDAVAKGHVVVNRGSKEHKKEPQK
jgi:hypothetical protein